MNFFLWIILGGLAGGIATIIIGNSHSPIEDIILGIIGGFVGGLIMSFFGESGVTGFNLYSFLLAIIGAVALVFFGRLIHG